MWGRLCMKTQRGNYLPFFHSIFPFLRPALLCFQLKKKRSIFHKACFLLCMLSRSHVWRHIIYLVVPTVTPAATQTVSRGLATLNCSLFIAVVFRCIHMSNYWFINTKNFSEDTLFHANVSNLAILPVRVWSIKASPETLIIKPISSSVSCKYFLSFSYKETIWYQCLWGASAFFSFFSF